MFIFTVNGVYLFTIHCQLYRDCTTNLVKRLIEGWGPMDFRRWCLTKPNTKPLPTFFGRSTNLEFVRRYKQKAITFFEDIFNQSNNLRTMRRLVFFSTNYIVRIVYVCVSTVRTRYEQQKMSNWFGLVPRACSFLSFVTNSTPGGRE